MGSRDGSEKAKSGCPMKKKESVMKTPPLHQPEEITDEDFLDLSHDELMEANWKKRRDLKRKWMNSKNNKKAFD